MAVFEEIELERSAISPNHTHQSYALSVKIGGNHPVLPRAALPSSGPPAMQQRRPCPSAVSDKAPASACLPHASGRGSSGVGPARRTRVRTSSRRTVLLNLVPPSLLLLSPGDIGPSIVSELSLWGQVGTGEGSHRRQRVIAAGRGR